jgi:uncharacterized protein YbaP (TraB family)
MRLRATFAALLALALAPLGFAQEATPKKPASDKAYMWHITSDTGEVWLLGSMHAVPEDTYPLPKEVEAAFKASHTLVVEMNALAAQGDQAKIQDYIKKGKYDEGDSLDKHITPETKKAVEEYLKKQGGAEFEQVAQYKGWFLAEQIEQGRLMQLGYDLTKGIDLHFLTKATKRNKKILEFATFEEQVEYLAGMSDKLQDGFLSGVIKDSDKQKEKLDTICEAWKSGDIAAMDKITVEARKESAEAEEITKRLLDERNVKMASKIEGWLKEKGPFFVVVGAAHIPGDKGILKLLDGKKLKIEQVKVAPKTDEKADDDKSDKSEKKAPAGAGAGGK